MPTRFSPRDVTAADLFEHYGPPAWVKRRISVSATDRDGATHTGKSWQGDAAGVRVEVAGGVLHIDPDGSALTAERLGAAKRLLVMVVPADSQHGRLRAPDTDAAFVAVFADRGDNLIGRGVSCVADIASIVNLVIFG